MARTPLYSRPARRGVDASMPLVVTASSTSASSVASASDGLRPGAAASAETPPSDKMHDSASVTASPGPQLPNQSDGDPAATARPGRWRAVRRGLARPGWWVVLPLLAFVAWSTSLQLRQRAAPLAINQIDAAIRDSIAKTPLRSAAALAYDAIIPSVVRVVGERDARPAVNDAKAGKFSKASAASRSSAGRAGDKAGDAKPGPHEGGDEEGRSVGTGVVIVDKGLILTNMHVVSGVDRIKVIFFDGSESIASVVNLQPDNDLAVLQAHTIPDDLQAATLRSTADLVPGDEVLAVGFPFGIGPSASTGVVSGLKREFRSSEGRRTLSNLIQFDAAANPGNSGGPLVTMDGHVVGIVTAIMNPNAQRTFIGIGFAVPIENAATAVGLAPF
jgi:S1-C subfamily serine protease